MAVPHASRFTVKEYLALEAVAESKHEYFGGYIVAMAGAEYEHNKIVEVLSESTELKDRGEKLLAYRTIPTLTDYLLVASTKRALDHYHRLPDGTWTLRELQDTGTATLGNGIVLELGSLYRRVSGLG